MRSPGVLGTEVERAQQAHDLGCSLQDTQEGLMEIIDILAVQYDHT